MAKKKSKKKEEEVLFDVVEVSKNTEKLFGGNTKNLIAIVGVLALIVVAFLAYKQFVVGPKEKNAAAAMMQAEMQFEKDSFALALTNPGGGNLGFLDIIDEYKGTDAANLANYYAGVSYLRLGKFEAAIEYLNDFKAAGKVLPIMKHGLLGDAYSELSQMDKAEAAYKKAISAGDNDFITPYYMKKLGMLYESLDNNDQALKVYSEIDAKYSDSPAGYTIEKYIDRVELKN